MPRDPLAALSRVATPQTQPIPGRTDQVPNAAGGYVFAKDTQDRVTDFLVLGTSGGTFYCGRDELTLENADVVFDAIRADGPAVVAWIVEISAARPARAPSNRQCLFALAAAFAYGGPQTRQAVKAALPKVARTTDHLSMYFGYLKNLGGKPTAHGTSPVTGRALRGALGSFFTADAPDKVAYRALKAMQRTTPQGEAFALRDVLRIAHPRTEDPELRALFGWIAGNVPATVARELVPQIDAYLTARAAVTPAQAVHVVTERKVPWEFLPDHVLTSPQVWEALVDTIGMTALIRNLARMTRIGALRPLADATGRAAARLTDRQALASARVHPMDAYLALRVYASGRSQPNPKAELQTWTPVAAILDALETAYELSFGYTGPTGRRLLVAVDSSGSMSHGGPQTGGSPLGTTYQVACAMAVMLARIEGPNAHVIDVDTRVHASRITGRTSLREIEGWRPSGGGTDLALPFAWARARRVDVDGIVVLTDNETWAGKTHPVQEFEAYRRERNRAARLVVASMTATGRSIGDPRDSAVLNVAGIDASLPLIVAGHARG